MGNTAYQQKTRKTPVALIGDSFRRVHEQFDSAAGDDPVVLPIVGIREAGSAQHVFQLAPGVVLVLEDAGARVDVYHGTIRLGYLGGDFDIVQQRLRGDRVLCRLHSRGGSEDEPFASVAVWL